MSKEVSSEKIVKDIRRAVRETYGMIATNKPFFYLPRTSGCLHEPFPSPLPKGTSQLTSHPADVVETAP